MPSSYCNGLKNQGGSSFPPGDLMPRGGPHPDQMHICTQQQQQFGNDHSQQQQQQQQFGNDHSQQQQFPLVPQKHKKREKSKKEHKHSDSGLSKKERKEEKVRRKAEKRARKAAKKERKGEEKRARKERRKAERRANEDGLNAAQQQQQQQWQDHQVPQIIVGNTAAASSSGASTTASSTDQLPHGASSIDSPERPVINRDSQELPNRHAQLPILPEHHLRSRASTQAASSSATRSVPTNATNVASTSGHGVGTASSSSQGVPHCTTSMCSQGVGGGRSTIVHPKDRSLRLFLKNQAEWEDILSHIEAEEPPLDAIDAQFERNILFSAACWRQDSRAIEYFLKRGASARHVDKMGQTPLFNAAKFAPLSAIKCLLNANADPDKTDSSKETALSLILKLPPEERRSDVVAFLSDAMQNRGTLSGAQTSSLAPPAAHVGVGTLIAAPPAGAPPAASLAPDASAHSTSTAANGADVVGSARGNAATGAVAESDVAGTITKMPTATRGTTPGTKPKPKRKTAAQRRNEKMEPPQLTKEEENALFGMPVSEYERISWEVRLDLIPNSTVVPEGSDHILVTFYDPDDENHIIPYNSEAYKNEFMLAVEHVPGFKEGFVPNGGDKLDNLPWTKGPTSQLGVFMAEQESQSTHESKPDTNPS